MKCEVTIGQKVSGLTHRWHQQIKQIFVVGRIKF